MQKGVLKLGLFRIFATAEYEWRIETEGLKKGVLENYQIVCFHLSIPIWTMGLF